MADMLKSTGAMAGATLASRILGMVREMCYARFMGDGLVAGAFVVAFFADHRAHEGELVHDLGYLREAMGELHAFDGGINGAGVAGDCSPRVWVESF